MTLESSGQGIGSRGAGQAPQPRGLAWAGPSGPLARLYAVLTRPMCEKACGKLPTSRPATGSYSSDSRPTSLRIASSRSKTRRASALAALERVVVGQPEGAGQERPLARRQAVHPGLGDVARDEPVGHQLPLDRRDGPEHPGVVRRQEADQGHHQQAGVELLRAVRLDEGPDLGVEPLAADLLVDLVADRPPAIDRAVEPVLLDRLDRPVERHPGHHLGVGEVPPRPADLPDPLVGLTPDRLEQPEQRPLHAPAVVQEPGLPAQVEHAQDLAVDVELVLVPGAVADPDRREPS